MENKKETRVKISEKNWKRAKKRADEVGISVPAWIADKIEEKLNEEEALKRLSPATEKAFAANFPEIYAVLIAKARQKHISGAQIKPAVDKLKKTSDTYFHSEKLEKASKNMLEQIKAVEPAIGRLKKASKDSFRADTWDKTSRRIHDELKSLEPSIEKLKKASQSYLHSEPVEKASKQFTDQMRAIEASLKKLLDRNKKEMK